MTYRVGRNFDESKFYMAAHQARAAAVKLGDPVCVWKKTSRIHWSLICDRSIPNGLPLSLLQHVGNCIPD